MSKIDEKTTLLDDIDAIETINDDNDTHSNVYAVYYESTARHRNYDNNEGSATDNLTNVNNVALFLIQNITWSDAFIPIDSRLTNKATNIIEKTLYINNSAKGVTATCVLQDTGKRILVKMGITIS